MAPWNRRFRTWTPSFIGSMLNFGVYPIIYRDFFIPGGIQTFPVWWRFQDVQGWGPHTFTVMFFSWWNAEIFINESTLFISNLQLNIKPAIRNLQWFTTIHLEWSRIIQKNLQQSTSTKKNLVINIKWVIYLIKPLANDALMIYLKIYWGTASTIIYLKPWLHQDCYQIVTRTYNVQDEYIIYKNHHPSKNGPQFLWLERTFFVYPEFTKFKKQ